MDIRCTICGDAWDIESLHHVGPGVGFDEAARLFRLMGCRAFRGQDHAPVIDKPAADAAVVLFDLLGDDVDGIAAMLEDAELFGMLD